MRTVSGGDVDRRDAAGEPPLPAGHKLPGRNGPAPGGHEAQAETHLRKLREHLLVGGQGTTEPVLRREVERDEPEARIRMLRREADVKGDVEDAQVGRIYGANLQFRHPIVQARTRRFTGRGSRLRDQEGILPTAPRVRMPLSTCGRWNRSSWSQSGDPSLRRCPCPALCERAVRIPAGTL